MNRLNIHAVVFWVLLSCIGWLFGGASGAVVGLAAGLAISLLLSGLR